MSGTEKSHAALLDDLAPWTLHSGLRWPNELRKAAVTFAGVPDGRDTAHMLRLLAHFLEFG